MINKKLKVRQGMIIKKITVISIFLLTFSILYGQEEEDKILLLSYRNFLFGFAPNPLPFSAICTR